MYFYQAVLSEVEASGKSLITEFDFNVIVWNCLNLASLGKIKVRNPPRQFETTVTKRAIRQLERKHAIVRDPDFKGHVWQVLQAPPLASAEEVICASDPFAYVAYLSALERYGFTNRSPKQLQIITYSSPSWGREKQILTNQETIRAISVKPTRPHPNPIVRRRPVEIYLHKKLGQNRKLRGSSVRVSTIAQTFLDSLEQPALCGGMAHVIDIWKEFASDHEEAIIAHFDASAAAINKVRAGYILESLVKSHNPHLEVWAKLAQRGGSRKLDPEAPYNPNYSEKWMLSLNV